MHTDYKLLDDGRWLIYYLDDASRFVTVYGTFKNAVVDNVRLSLEQIIKEYGKPTSIMTDHDHSFMQMYPK